MRWRFSEEMIAINDVNYIVKKISQELRRLLVLEETLDRLAKLMPWDNMEIF